MIDIAKLRERLFVRTCEGMLVRNKRKVQMYDEKNGSIIGHIIGVNENMCVFL